MRPEGDKLRAQPSAVSSREPDESSSPSPTPSPSTGAPDQEQEEAGAPQRPLITDGVTVQVLDAAGSSGAQDRMVDRLVTLGFAVPYEAEASTTYADTTVYWSYPAAETAARRLAGRFGWKSGVRPANLSPDVTIHVVVGRDEAQR